MTKKTSKSIFLVFVFFAFCVFTVESYSKNLIDNNIKNVNKVEKINVSGLSDVSYAIFPKWITNDIFTFSTYIGKNTQTFKISDINGQIIYEFNTNSEFNDLFIDAFFITSYFGKRIAFVQNKKTISIYDLSTKIKTELYEFEEGIILLGWSPDGKDIIFAKRTNNAPDCPTVDILTISFPDGRISKIDNDLTMKGDTNLSFPFFEAKWSPDGKTILVRMDRVLYAFSTKGDTRVELLKTSLHDENAIIESAYWSLDGNSITMIITKESEKYHNFYEVWIMNLKSKEIKKYSFSKIEHLGYVNSFARFSPDKRYIAFSACFFSNDGLADSEKIFIKDIQNLNNYPSVNISKEINKILKKKQIVRSHDDYVGDWSPDGKKILFILNEFKLEKSYLFILYLER